MELLQAVSQDSFEIGNIELFVHFLLYIGMIKLQVNKSIVTFNGFVL